MANTVAATVFKAVFSAVLKVAGVQMQGVTPTLAKAIAGLPVDGLSLAPACALAKIQG